MKRLVKLIPLTIIGMAIFIILVLTYWAIYPYNPLVLSNVILNKTEVSRGEHLIISADYCKNVEKEADLFISFVDGVIYNTPPQVIDLENGCHRANLSVYIPKALPTGKFSLKEVFRYKVNPIRSIDVNHLSSEFTIIK